MRFSRTKLDKVQAHIYIEDSQSNFSYFGEMNASDSMNVPLTYNETLHITVSPSSVSYWTFQTNVKTIDPNEKDEERHLNPLSVLAASFGTL